MKNVIRTTVKSELVPDQQERIEMFSDIEKTLHNCVNTVKIATAGLNVIFE